MAVKGSYDVFDGEGGSETGAGGKAASAAASAAASSSGKYTLQQLTTLPYPEDVDSNKREVCAFSRTVIEFVDVVIGFASHSKEYLEDNAFLVLFGMNFSSYAALPQWKKVQLKKRAGLF